MVPSKAERGRPAEGPARNAPKSAAGEQPEAPAGVESAEDARAPATPFWGRLLAILGPGGDPERTKRRLLKAIAREVRHDRAVYYVPRTDSAGPGLAKLLHTFHCTLGPARTLLDSALSSEALRSMVIESCLSPEELELRDGLTQDGIGSDAQAMDAPRLADRLRRDLDRFTAAFTPRIAAANARMTDFLILLDLVSFDFHGVLKRFDPSMPRDDYAYVPAFAPVNSEYVVADVRELAEILQGVDPAADWDPLLDVLAQYRRMETVSRGAWGKLLRSIERLKRSGILLAVIRLMEHDPHAAIAPRSYPRRGAEEYLEKVRVQAELALQKALAQKRAAKIDEMIRKTFGGQPEIRLAHYLPGTNPSFEKKGSPGYSHCAPLNYLKVYLSDHLPKEIKNVVDLVLVKGRWAATHSSHSLSESLQALIKIAAQLEEFDDSLAEDGQRGQKVKAAMIKAGRNKKEAYLLRQAIRLVNETARGLTTAGIQALVSLGRMLKTLLDDCGAKEPRLVLNWRDLEGMSEHQLKGRLAAGYTRLYNLVQLLGQYRDTRPG